MEQVENYRVGSLDITKDLGFNSISRLDHDATKLSTVLRKQQQLVAEVKLQLSNNALPATRCDQASSDVEAFESKILRMLDKVKH